MHTYCARHANNRLRIFYHSDYFRSGTEKAQGECDPLTRATLDAFDSLAGSPEFCLSMDLDVGDAQFVSNHSIVHARGAYLDGPHQESQRHLLRLWLSIPDRSDASWLRASAWAQTLGSAAMATLRGVAR